MYMEVNSELGFLYDRVPAKGKTTEWDRNQKKWDRNRRSKEQTSHQLIDFIAYSLVTAHQNVSQQLSVHPCWK